MREKEIIRACIEKLSELKGKPVQLLTSTGVGGGCINNAMKISTSDGDYFLKWNSSAHADLFQREADGLYEIGQAENRFLIVPKVIWSKESDELPGLILMEYLSPASRSAESEELLGRGLALMHKSTTPSFGFYRPNYCGTTLQDNTWTTNWPEFYAFRRIMALVRQLDQVRGLSVEEKSIYEKLVDRIPQLLPHQTVPSLIHGDLWSGNYMFTVGGPALIDPACYYADREMELGMMQLFGGFSSYVWSAYQEEFPLPEGWRERIRLYQLYHVLNHYLLFGGSYGWQALGIAKEYV
jgi:protein-ribulosamine 3-kinase